MKKISRRIPILLSLLGCLVTYIGVTQLLPSPSSVSATGESTSISIPTSCNPGQTLTGFASFFSGTQGNVFSVEFSGSLTSLTTVGPNPFSPITVTTPGAVSQHFAPPNAGTSPTLLATCGSTGSALVFVKVKSGTNVLSQSSELITVNSANVPPQINHTPPIVPHNDAANQKVTTSASCSDSDSTVNNIVVTGDVDSSPVTCSGSTCNFDVINPDTVAGSPGVATYTIQCNSSGPSPGHEKLEGPYNAGFTDEIGAISLSNFVISGAVNGSPTINSLTANNIPDLPAEVTVAFDVTVSDDDASDAGRNFTGLTLGRPLGWSVSGPALPTTRTPAQGAFSMTVKLNKNSSLSGNIMVSGNDSHNNVVPPAVQAVGIGGSSKRHKDQINDDTLTCESPRCKKVIEEANKLFKKLKDLESVNSLYPLNNGVLNFNGPVFEPIKKSIEQRWQDGLTYMNSVYQILQEYKTLKAKDPECFGLCLQVPCVHCKVDTSILEELLKSKNSYEYALRQTELKIADPGFRHQGGPQTPGGQNVPADTDYSLAQQKKSYEKKLQELNEEIKKEDRLIKELYAACSNNAASAGSQVCQGDEPPKVSVPSQQGDDASKTISVPSCNQCALYLTAAEYLYNGPYLQMLDAIKQLYKKPSDDSSAKIVNAKKKKDSLKAAILRLLEKFNNCKNKLGEGARCPAVRDYSKDLDFCADVCGPFMKNFEVFSANVCKDLNVDQKTINEQIQRLKKEIESKSKQVAQLKGEVANLEATVSEGQKALNQAYPELYSLPQAKQAGSSLGKGVAKLEKQMSQKQAELTAKQNTLDANQKAIEGLQKALQELESKKSKSGVKDRYEKDRKEYDYCVKRSCGGFPTKPLSEVCKDEKPSGDQGKNDGDKGGNQGDKPAGGDKAPGGSQKPDGQGDQKPGDGVKPPAGGDKGTGGTQGGPDGKPPEPPKPPKPPIPPTEEEIYAYGKKFGKKKDGVNLFPGLPNFPGASIGTTEKPATGAGSTPSTQGTQEAGHGAAGTESKDSPQEPSLEQFPLQVCGKTVLQNSKQDKLIERQNLILQGGTVDKIDAQIKDLDAQLAKYSSVQDPVSCQNPLMGCVAGTFARQKLLKDAINDYPVGPLTVEQQRDRDRLRQSLDGLTADLQNKCPSASLSCDQLNEYKSHLLNQRSQASVNQNMLGLELSGLENELRTRNCGTLEVSTGTSGEKVTVRNFLDGTKVTTKVYPDGRVEEVRESSDGTKTVSKTAKGQSGTITKSEEKYDKNGHLTETNETKESYDKEGRKTVATETRDPNGKLVKTEKTITDPKTGTTTKTTDVPDPENPKTLSRTTETTDSTGNKTIAKSTVSDGKETTLSKDDKPADCTPDSKKLFDEYVSKVVSMNQRGANVDIRERIEFSEFQKKNQQKLNHLREYSVCGAFPVLGLPCVNSCQQNSPALQELNKWLDIYKNPGSGDQAKTKQLAVDAIKRLFNDNNYLADFNKYFACASALKSIAASSAQGFQDPLINQCPKIPELPPGVNFAGSTISRQEMYQETDPKDPNKKIGNPIPVTISTDANGKETLCREHVNVLPPNVKQTVLILESVPPDGTQEEISIGQDAKGNPTQTSIKKVNYQGIGPVEAEKVVTTYAKGTRLSLGCPKVSIGGVGTVEKIVETTKQPLKGGGFLTTEKTTEPKGGKDKDGNTVEKQTVVRDLNGKKDPPEIILGGKSDCESCKNIDPQLLQGYLHWQRTFQKLQDGSLEIRYSDGSTKSVMSPEQIQTEMKNYENVLNQPTASVDAKGNKTGEGASANEKEIAKNNLRQLNQRAQTSYRTAQKVYDDYEAWRKNLASVPKGLENLQAIEACHKLVAANKCPAPYTIEKDPNALFGGKQLSTLPTKKDYLEKYKGSSGGPGGHNKAGQPRKWIQYDHEAGPDSGKVTVEKLADGSEKIVVEEGNKVVITEVSWNGEVVVTEIEKHADGTLKRQQVTQPNGSLQQKERTYDPDTGDLVIVESEADNSWSDLIVVSKKIQRRDGSFQEYLKDGRVRIGTIASPGSRSINVTELDPTQPNPIPVYLYTDSPRDDQTVVRVKQHTTQGKDPCLNTLTPESYLNELDFQLSEQKKAVELRLKEMVDRGEILSASLESDPEWQKIQKEREKIADAMREFVRLSDLIRSAEAGIVPGYINRLHDLFDAHPKSQYFPALQEMVRTVDKRVKSVTDCVATKSGFATYSRGVPSKAGSSEGFFTQESLGLPKSESASPLSFQVGTVSLTQSSQPCDFRGLLARLQQLQSKGGLNPENSQNLQKIQGLLINAMTMLEEIQNEQHQEAMKYRIQQFYNFLSTQPQFYSFLQSSFSTGGNCSLFAFANHFYGTHLASVDVRDAKTTPLSAKNACIEIKDYKKINGLLKGVYQQLIGNMSKDEALRVIDSTLSKLVDQKAMSPAQSQVIFQEFRTSLSSPVQP